ncbi:MAG TPA: transposase [Verrucomicrobiae bacterium]|nr:transposase [Verrucomicrobiae bacterium]
MARPLRIQYPGAVYHVMARGNHGQRIFQDNRDRQCFLETLGEACEKTGWRIHAYVLMGNHYHLLVETPEGNLVSGMKWAQGVYTQRYNSRHKLFGHLFQGRYKAVIVDGQDVDYFSVVSTYIHLNPARAKLIRIGAERLKRYRWSSYPWYLNRAGRQPGWLSTERVLGNLGFSPRAVKGYEAYIEGRVLELASPRGRKELDEEWKALRRGWYVGGKGFVEKLQEHLEGALKGRQRESHNGGAKVAHDEAAAEEELNRGFRLLSLNEAALERLPKGAPEKVVLAWWLRRRTTVSLRWVSERLSLGHYTRVTQAISRVERRPGRKINQIKCKLARLESGKAT